ncbi:4'-phosphopantetheinyl transferase superfamily protein [bacterium]|nr:4'-phosphopantetheinyl transferase superfamily protein [bacterium]
MSRLIETTPEVIDLWIAHVSDWVGTPAVTRLIECLSSEERDRARKFAFDRDRDVYHLAHGMLRTVLSKYDNREPSEWRFVANRHGKPSIEGFNFRSLQFNISHTAGLAVVGVTCGSEIGVDVESLSRTRVRIEVASKAFAPAEREKVLAILDESAKRKRFFEIWTLKESFIKAKGVGLSLALDQFWFDWKKEEFEFCVVAALQENPTDWQFHLMSEVSDYLIAVASRAGSQRFKVRTHSFQPES